MNTFLKSTVFLTNVVYPISGGANIEAHEAQASPTIINVLEKFCFGLGG